MLYLSLRRYQDTEKNNQKSIGIESKMKVEIGKDIKFYYCVKTSSKDDDVPWPKGSYCIAKKDDCPIGMTKIVVTRTANGVHCLTVTTTRIH